MIRVMFRLFAENWPGKYQNHIRKAESQTIVFFFLSLFLVFQYPLYKICKVRKIPQCACSHIVGVKRWAQRRQGQNFRFAVPFFRLCLSTWLTRDVFITFSRARSYGTERIFDRYYIIICVAFTRNHHLYRRPAVQSSVWTERKYWTVPCQRSVWSNFSAGRKFRPVPWVWT